MSLNEVPATLVAKDEKYAKMPLESIPTDVISIYEVAPEFSHCFAFEGKMYFAKREAVEELEELGIKVFLRKNHE